MMLECNMLMENTKNKELYNSNEILLVPFVFDVSITIAYRQSVDDDGLPEPYTVIYTEFGERYCIDIPFKEFKTIFNNSIDDSKTV